MFTPNDKNYCKRDSGNHFGSGLVELVGPQLDLSRGYNEDLVGKPRGRAGHGSEPNGNVYDEGHCDRRLPPQSSGDRGYEEDQEQRKVRFRSRGRKVYGKETTPDRIISGVRNEGAFDEESSLSSDRGYGGLSGFPKTPPDYFRTPPEILTPPEFAKTPPDQFAKSKTHGEHQSHGNQLLHLRAALNEKELQLVELREQHIIVLNRAADARQNWEEALQSKDRVILQLQRTLKHNKTLHDRQERENQENLHALRKRQKQETAEVEKKELQVALLEAKNAQFVQELVEQQKLITKMKRHIDEKEKLCANHCQKLEMMNGRIQDLKSALQLKEDEAATQSKYCNELKNLLWKRDSIIAQLQLSEQQLQSSLAREEAAREAQAMSREKVQDEKNSTIEKRLSEMQKQQKSPGNEAPHNESLLEREQRRSEMRKLMELKDDFSNVQESVEKDLNDKEGVMHRIQKRMRELQRCLRHKDIALSDKNNEYQDALMEIRRLTEDYEAIKHECEELNRRNYELESTVAHLEYPDRRMDAASVSEAPTPPVEVLPYAFSLGGSTGEDLGFDNAMQDSMEWEQLSNASVYHANFEKIKIIEVEMPDIDPHQQQQQQQQQPATSIQPSHPSFQTPSPMRTQNPPTPSAAASPTRRRPVEAEEPQQSAPPPSAGPLNKDAEAVQSEFEANCNSIQDEIKKREQCWRKTEELMREALTRRLKLLEEAKEIKTLSKVQSLGTQSILQKEDYHNVKHYVQAAASTRADTDHKSSLEQGNRMQREKQIDNERRSSCQHAAQRKASHQGGHKCHHGHDGARAQLQNYEQEVYQLDCRLHHEGSGNFKKVGHVHNRRRYEQDILIDKRRSAHQNTHPEDCTKPSEHYGHCERNASYAMMLPSASSGRSCDVSIINRKGSFS
ncbi:hypothetical protein KC19_10G058300 [Ceratodon purpureus]|uniref:Uncharacterized protein n=1 Tax=Ceratodon purpureus TaxID=3225 RepID=A0A8T0GIJ3_CERPU|nr:hypothetical protein KC19_10G058300 [Ceratodon purpureus]